MSGLPARFFLPIHPGRRYTFRRLTYLRQPAARGGPGALGVIARTTCLECGVDNARKSRVQGLCRLYGADNLIRPVLRFQERSWLRAHTTSPLVQTVDLPLPDGPELRHLKKAKPNYTLADQRAILERAERFWGEWVPADGRSPAKYVGEQINIRYFRPSSKK